MAAAAGLFLLLIWAIGFAVCAGLYFLPTIIAVMQHRTNVGIVAVINILLGWSLVGWIVALVLALTREPQPVIVQVQQMGYPQGGPGRQYVPPQYERPVTPPYGSQLRQGESFPERRE